MPSACGRVVSRQLSRTASPTIDSPVFIGSRVDEKHLDGVGEQLVARLGALLPEDVAEVCRLFDQAGNVSLGAGRIPQDQHKSEGAKVRIEDEAVQFQLQVVVETDQEPGSLRFAEEEKTRGAAADGCTALLDLRRGARQSAGQSFGRERVQPGVGSEECPDGG
jgi:hypothetical protein